MAVHELVAPEVFVLCSCCTAEAFARPLAGSGTGLPGWCWLCSAGKDIFPPAVMCLNGWL